MPNTRTARLGFTLASVALILSACGGPDQKPQPDLNAAKEVCALPARPAGEQPGVLCGQLSGVTAAQVKPTPQEVETPREDLIASVKNNQFNQQLPSVAAVNNEYVPKNDPIAFRDMFVCGSNFNTSASDELKIIPLNLLQTNTGQQINVMKRSGSSVNFTFWWYANKTENVTVSGTDCFTYGSFSNQTLDLKRGWNVVTFTLNDSLKNSSFVAGAPTAKRYTWVAANTASGMVAQSVAADPYFLMPWLHLEQYQNRR